MTETVGQLAKRLRDAAGLTQGQVEEYAKIDRTWVSKLEADHWKKPNRERLEQLARLYRVPPETLLAKAGHRVTPLPPPSAPSPVDLARQLLASLQQPPDEELDLLLDYVKDMTPEERASVLRFVESVRSQREEDGESSGAEGA